MTMTAFQIRWLALAVLLAPVFFIAACKPSAMASVAHDDPAASSKVVSTSDAATLAQVRADAEKGNAVAQFALGQAYFVGQGVAQDYTQAVSWFRKAAEQGDVAAQYNLGMMYCKGQGVSKDEVQAKFWLSKAAAQGDTNAQKALAR